MADTPEQTYRDRAREFAGTHERVERRMLRIGGARLVAFIAAVGLLFWAEIGGGPIPGAGLVAGAVVLLVGFVVLIVVHDRLRGRARRLRELRRVNEEAVHRLARDWDRLPDPGLGDPPAGHAFAGDLDLLGHASLAQLVGPIGSPGGRVMLREWLLSPAPPKRARERQEAVADLTARIDLRDELAVRGRLGGARRAEEIEGFLDWATGEPWLSTRPLLVWASRLLPLATITLGIPYLLGNLAAHFWLLPLAGTLVLARTHGRRVDATFDRAFARDGLIEAYPAMFGRVLAEDFDAPALRVLRDRLTAAGTRADAVLRRLERIASIADARHGSFHALLNLLTLWDFHTLWLLERWQRSAGPQLRGWFGALAEIEALSALAGLAHAEPGWAFATVSPDAPMIEAEDLGHPLIPDEERVGNDVTVGPGGTFLLVTGSNMSGKSTLLRAIGINAVLAQAGGPVCARRMRLPPVVPHTSIRVEDSLEQGVSYFLAELQRIKGIVDAAGRLPRADGDGGDGFGVLYLIDEMLRGTNAEERRIAARRVLRHLLSAGAIGAVTTHDLGLADSPELERAREAVHFTESIHRTDGRPTISFDYRLRRGLATSSNALALMEAIGLELASEE